MPALGGRPPPERRTGGPRGWRRWPVVLGVVLAVTGLAGAGFGSFRLATAAELRDRAAAVTARSEAVSADVAAVEVRFRERAAEADRLRDADTAVGDGVIAILRSTGAVLRRYNAMVDAFNRSVEAYNVGNLSGSAAIIEQEAAPAIEDVADAVRRQGRTLAGVRRALRILERALEA